MKRLPGVDHTRQLSARLRLLKPKQGLPRLFAVTDPTRTQDVFALARRLPAGAGLIYRAFGASDALFVGRELRRLTRRRGVFLLIGADARLAMRCGADGVHLPQRLVWRAAALKRTQPDWLITATAHEGARPAHYDGVDAVVLSPVFPTRSAGSGAAIGVRGAAAMARAFRKPCIALGGINVRTARRALSAGFHGIAGVDLFAL
jgi:thiamine-phosphate pyrophosphorylase